MKWSLKIGRISGIRILVHWTFLILLGWIIFHEINRGSDLPTILLTIGYVLSIFICVILHELGHALMAKKYKVNTRKITLLPIGGVASLDKIPEDPKKEFWVAVAGPVVNVAIAFILAIIIQSPWQTITSDLKSMTVLTSDNFLFSLMLINILLVVFNAIPAFPMDGGRVLRALLAMRMGRSKATKIAALLGQTIAFIFFILGFFFNPFLVFIGLFVFLGAYSENTIVQQTEFLRDFEVEEAMMTNFTTISPHDTIDNVKDVLISGSETSFVVVHEDLPVGVVTQKDLVKALKNGQADEAVATIMKRDVEVFNPREKLNAIFEYLQRKRDLVFPVVTNDKINGIINSENVYEFITIKSALRY